MKRIEAYTRAIKAATEKIKNDYCVDIVVEEKAGGTIQFTVVADSSQRADNTVQHIQGEFCDVSEVCTNNNSFPSLYIISKLNFSVGGLLCKVQTKHFYFLISQISAQKKYDSDRHLPSAGIKGISGPTEAKKKLSESEQKCLQSEGNRVLLTEAALRKHDIKHMTGPCELRQFACGPCDHPWWRIVPVSKMVSRCRECHIRYDALDREKEFGIGRFQCTKPACKRVFFAKCQATDVLSCRKCKTHVRSPHIHPRWRKHQHVPRSRPGSGSRQNHLLNPSAAPFVPASKQKRREPSFEPVSLQRSLNKMSISASNSHSYAPSNTTQPTPSQPRGVGPSVAPQKKSTQDSAPGPAAAAEPLWKKSAHKPKVINASRVHNSSGSTVSTFITQMDENDFDEEVPLDYDSDEDGVGACRFECDCGNRYTVLCEMTDKARCYECDRNNEPMGWAPPRNLDKETSNPHSCSKCEGQPGCPNLQAVAGQR